MQTFSPTDVELIAGIMTGHDKRRSLDFLSQLEKMVVLCNDEVRRLEGQLEFAREKRQMYYDTLKMAGGLNIPNPPDEFCEEVFNIKPELPVELPPAPEPLMPVITPATLVAETRPPGKHGGPRKKTNLTKDEFATWYNLVFEEFKTWPTDQIGGLYFGIKASTVRNIRLKAIEADLITYKATKNAGSAWARSGVTLADIVGHLGVR